MIPLGFIVILRVRVAALRLQVKSCQRFRKLTWRSELQSLAGDDISKLFRMPMASEGPAASICDTIEATPDLESMPQDLDAGQKIAA